MSSSMLIARLGGRFHPGTQEQFDRYAEHLKWLVRNRHFQSRETLARIYQYQNVNELEQTLKTPATPGPFDDAIAKEMLECEQIQRVLAVRNAQAMKIVIESVKATTGSKLPDFGLPQLCALKLFSSPLAHYAAFRGLVILENSALLAHPAMAQ